MDIRFVRALTTFTAILVAACSTVGGNGGHSESVHGPRATTASDGQGTIEAFETQTMETYPLDESLETIPEAYGRAIVDFRSSLPSPLPAHAVAIAKLVRTEEFDSNVVDLSSDGRVSTDVYIANPSGIAYGLNVLCLRNFIQVPCLREAPVPTLAMSRGTFATVPLKIVATRGDRFDVVLAVEGDESRPTPATSAVMFFAGEPSDPVASQVSRKSPVWTGCDFARIVDSDEPREPAGGPRPSEIQIGKRRMFVLVQTCDPSAVIHPILVRDRRLVVETSTSTRTTQLEKGTFFEEVRVHDSLMNGSIMVVTLVLAGQDADRELVSHPIRVTS